MSNLPSAIWSTIDLTKNTIGAEDDQSIYAGVAILLGR